MSSVVPLDTHAPLDTHGPLRARPALDAEIPVARVMTRDPVTIDADASLDEAHERMLRAAVRHLPVLSDGRLVDVISDRDLAVYRGLARSTGSMTGPLTVNEIRSGMPPYVCTPQTPLDTVARCLLVTKATSAVVLDEQEQVVGIFTAVDALRFVGGQLRPT